MITIHVTGRDDVRRSHLVPTQGPLMLALRDTAGEPVEGLCGGCATCGTCHVFVSPNWIARLGALTEHEAMMLDMLEHHNPDLSRLACQLELTADLDGLCLTLAPQE